MFACATYTYPMNIVRVWGAHLLPCKSLPARVPKLAISSQVIILLPGLQRFLSQVPKVASVPIWGLTQPGKVALVIQEPLQL